MKWTQEVKSRDMRTHSSIIRFPTVLLIILRSRENERHFEDDISKCTFQNETCHILILYVPCGPILNRPALVQVMDWGRTGDKIFSEAMMAWFTDAYMRFSAGLWVRAHLSIHQHFSVSLRWRHNGLDSVSNHQPHDCLFNRLFRRRSKKTSKLRVTGLFAGIYRGPVNSTHKWPVTRKMFPFDDVIMWIKLHTYGDGLLCIEPD